MDLSDAINLALAAAWVLAALACWLQPWLDQRRTARGLTPKGAVGPRLRIASTTTCLLLALGALLSLPLRTGSLPLVLGRAVAILGGLGLVVTLVLLVQDRRARRS